MVLSACTRYSTYPSFIFPIPVMDGTNKGQIAHAPVALTPRLSSTLLGILL